MCGFLTFDALTAAGSRGMQNIASRRSLGVPSAFADVLDASPLASFRSPPTSWDVMPNDQRGSAVPPTQVFLSYARKDRTLVVGVREQLAVFEHDNEINQTEGWFTVAAIADRGRTLLSYSLKKPKGAPQWIRDQ